jgi:CO/xanthine dehydrogenase Mo-binding subunit
MKIAILGWGSLLWDPRDLKLATPFELTGPSLPIEFCRVAKDHRLTLIIDETFGTLCPTYAATSAYNELDDAIENLRQREGMSSVSDVGFVEIATQERSPMAIERHPHALETIADWALHSGYDAAIWTALDSLFQGRTKEPFSVNAAMRFLENLEQRDPEAFARALEYIRRAPAATQTPVRDATVAQWPETTDG